MCIYEQTMPLCENGCGKQAIRFTKKGKAVCCHRPAQCSAVQEKMQKTSIEKYGVSNASSTQAVKDKRKQQALDKYGVDNVSKAESIKSVLSKKKTEYWNQLRDVLITESKENAIALTRKEYNSQVWKITNLMFNLHRELIDPEHKRGNAWHLDHKVSRFYGFYARIPPHIIGDVTNLELIPGLVNETKRHENSIAVEELYARYNDFYRTYESPVYTDLLFVPDTRPKSSMFTTEIGICSYCGDSAHYLYDSGKMCCSPHRTQCPTIREKNSTSQRNSEIKKIATLNRNKSIKKI